MQIDVLAHELVGRRASGQLACFVPAKDPHASAGHRLPVAMGRLLCGGAEPSLPFGQAGYLHAVIASAVLIQRCKCRHFLAALCGARSSYEAASWIRQC